MADALARPLLLSPDQHRYLRELAGLPHQEPAGPADAVRYLRPAAIAIRHPDAGLITLQMFQLRLVDQPGLVAVIQVPANPVSLSRVQSLPGSMS